MAIKPLVERYLMKSSHRLVSIIFWGLVNSIATFLIPVSIGNFFILKFSSEGSKGRLLEMLGIYFSTLNSFYLFFFSLILIKVLSGFIEKWMSLKEGDRFVKFIRERLFEAQLKTEPVIFSQKPYGNYLLRYSGDLKSVKNYLQKGILEGIKSFLFLFMGISLLALLQAQLTSYLLILFVAVFVLFSLLAGYQKRFIKERRDKSSNLLAFVAKCFSRQHKLKLEGSVEKTLGRFREKSDQVYQSGLKNNRIESLRESLMPGFQYTILGTLLWMSTYIKPGLSYGDALVYILILIMLMSSMRRILRVPGYLNKGKISLYKIEELIKLESSVLPEIKEIPV